MKINSFVLKLIIALIVILVGQVIMAETLTKYLEGPRLKGQGEVQILGFDKKFSMVELISLKSPGEGSFFVLSRDLIDFSNFEFSKDARMISQIKKFDQAIVCQKLAISKSSMRTFMKNQPPLPSHQSSSTAHDSINRCKKNKGSQ